MRFTAVFVLLATAFGLATATFFQPEVTGTDSGATNVFATDASNESYLTNVFKN